MNHAFKQFVLTEGAKLEDSSKYSIISIIDTKENEIYILDGGEKASIEKIRTTIAEVPDFSKRYQVVASWKALHRITRNAKYKALIMSVAELAKHLKGEAAESKTDSQKWMAYNHHGTPLMNDPTDRATAQKEADLYRRETSNASYVDKV